MKRSLLAHVIRTVLSGLLTTVVEDVIGATALAVAAARPWLTHQDAPIWNAFVDCAWVVSAILLYHVVRAILIVWQEVRNKSQLKEVESGLYLPNATKERHFERDDPPKFYQVKLLTTGVVFAATLAGGLFGVTVVAQRHLIHETQVVMELFGEDRLMFDLANTTTIPAEKPKYWFELVDTTNCFKSGEIKGLYPAEPSKCEPLPLQVQMGDYINGNGREGHYEVLMQSGFWHAIIAHVKPNDILVGRASVTCINCLATRRYYLYFKIGYGGWFYPIAKTDITYVPTSPEHISEQTLHSVVDGYVPLGGRLRIPVTHDDGSPTTDSP